MTINDLKIGEKGIIVSIDLDKEIRSRLMDMGLTKGTEVQLLKKAPFGDPIWLLVRDYHLIFRREYALKINIALVRAENNGDLDEDKSCIDRQSK